MPDPQTPREPGGRLAPWRTLTSRVAYQNPWIRVDEEQAEMPDGRTTLYGVVRCGGCVGVLPFLDTDTVILVRQYRYVARAIFWEMPTGGVHAGESLEQAAHRELAEETGYTAERLEPLVSFHTSKSVVDEVAHLYTATRLHPGPARLDETEFLEARPWPFAAVLAMVECGEIKDSMTVIAVLHAARRQRR